MSDRKSGDGVKKDAGNVVVNLFGSTPTDALTGNASANAVQGNAFDPEDEYQAFYAGATRDLGILEPPYKLRQLDRLCIDNNALAPCIEAMVTNIDGTGFTFEAKDQEENPEAEADATEDADDAKIEELREFFSEPWPGMSFTKIRKLVRRDIERVGNGYIEVVRNPQGDVVFFRHVDAKMMRIVRLDAATEVAKKVMRKGKAVPINVMIRERRYCQLLNGVTLLYFREFGASRDLNKKSGQWAAKGSKLPAQSRATEIIHFTALPDAHTPYGVPRWINQIPSVLGSRKAEELNLDFFDNGGMPPVMLILQGGSMMPETRKRLEEITKQGAMKANRVAVVEVESTGGDLDSSSSGAKVVVERFGSERQDDSMFEDYDAKCEERVRRSFRLPPIFVGAADSYTFATAFASYTVAEAQVFKPERDAFDEMLTMGLIVAMGYDDHMLVSKPLVIEDGTLKLQGLELGISTQRVDYKSIILEINEATGTNMKLMAADDPANPDNPSNKAPTHGMTVDENGNVVPALADPANPNAPSAPTGANNQGAAPSGSSKVPQPAGARAKPPNGGAGTSTPMVAARKSEGNVLDLAREAMTAMRKRDSARLGRAMATVAKFDDMGMAAFRKACTELHFVDATLDAPGMAQLTGCTMAVLAREGVLKFDSAEARDDSGKWTSGSAAQGGGGKKGKLTAKDTKAISYYRKKNPDSEKDITDEQIAALFHVSTYSPSTADEAKADEAMRAGHLYHGTWEGLKAAILKDGIKAGGSKGSDAFLVDHKVGGLSQVVIGGDNQQYAYVTPYKKLAKAYGELAASNHGGKPIIFQATVPEGANLPIEGDPHDKRAFRVPDKIDPKWLKVVKAEAAQDASRVFYITILVDDDGSDGDKHD